MSDYLKRFQSKACKKADPELIDRWEWEVRFNGDSAIKNQLANAKRIATSMERAMSQFSNLKPEHELAIKAAASAMRTLASQLTALAAWAKDYKVFCDAEHKREAADVLEALATKRWGSDAAAVRFEADLMRELGTDEGRVAFGSWCHANGRYSDCRISEIHSAIDHIAAGEATERAAAARTVQGGMEHRTPNKWVSTRGPTVICSWSDYEAYLAYRREVAAAAGRLVASAASR